MAEEYSFIIEQLPQHLEGRVAAQASALQVTSVGSTEDYLIDKLKLWDNSRPIKVCFFGGTDALRSRIAKIAMQWADATGLLPSTSSP